MATYRDPVECFAPLEVIERLLELRAESGYREAIFLMVPGDLAASMDACGFDAYPFSRAPRIHFGDYRGPVAPNGDKAHGPLRTH